MGKRGYAGEGAMEQHALKLGCVDVRLQVRRYGISCLRALAVMTVVTVFQFTSSAFHMA